MEDVIETPLEIVEVKPAKPKKMAGWKRKGALFDEHGKNIRKKNGLTAREKRFCELLVSGQTATRSYLLAGYKCNDHTACVNGNLIQKRPKLQKYIAELREAQFGASLLSNLERRAILAEIARATRKNISPDSVAANVTLSKEGEEIALPPKTADKINALKLDADLAGEGTPQVNLQLGIFQRL